jgi:ion channel
MNEVISPLHFLRGLGMVGLTVIIQATAQIALTRFLRAVPPPRGQEHLTYRGIFYVVAAVLILVIGLIGEVTLWALLYYLWGDLGSFANAVYFSLACFTTMGASDLVLSPFHRIVGTTEAAVGMLMFGWSTALLFEVIQSMRGAPKSAA